jgi:Porin PorA
MRRRRWGIAGVCVGVALIAASAGFRMAAVPALVRFPLDVDTSATYTGTAWTYVDPGTLLPLATPQGEPLSITRHVKVVEGGFDKAVVHEAVEMKIGSATTNTEEYQYVMDRRAMTLVDEPRQFALGDPAATMHGSGAYRINFAMGTTATGSYLAYIPEADTTTPLVLVRGPHHHAEGNTTVIDFATKLEAPVAPYYRAHLEAMGLPMQVTAAQIAPQLAAAGIDVNQALADVAPRLTPAETEQLATILAAPVPLNYFFVVDGTVSVEPQTGALIDVHSQQEGVAVQPDLSGVTSLQPLLDKYAAIPSVKALSDGLAAMAAQPPQLAQTFQYTQTPASSLSVADTARDQARVMTIVTWWVPGVLGGLGVLLLALGLFGWLGGRSRRRATPPRVTEGPRPNAPDTEPEATDQAEEPRELVLAGSPAAAPADPSSGHAGETTMSTPREAP